MKCPYCAVIETKVIDSRLNQSADITRRRRECPKCGGRFTTYERVEEMMPLVIKKDGRREAFSREKILSGLHKACQKRPVTTQRLDEALVLIERQIQSWGLKEIPAKTLGEMVMNHLNRIDKVAYIRFASVYREFKDVEEFVQELHQAPDPAPAVDENETLMFPFANNNSLPGLNA